MFVTTVQDIIFGIITQKEATGMTNQQIADSAKVSKTTVDRLLRNDPGTSPNAQTLIDVANAVGYQIGGTEPHSEVPGNLRGANQANGSALQQNAYTAKSVAALCCSSLPDFTRLCHSNASI